MGGGDLNLKKSWHPHTMKNQERVWKAEQAKNEEDQKLHDLRKEIEQERNREDLKRLGENSGVLSKNENNAKLEWMYKSSKELINREEYLLGRKIDKSFETLQAEEQHSAGSAVGVKKPLNHVEHECIPFSIREFRNMQCTEQVDLQRKTMEDPLMLIKQRELESRRKLLENPVKLKEIHRILKTERTLKESKTKKPKKKSSKKSKKKKKKRSSDSSSSQSGSESDADSTKNLDKELEKRYKQLKSDKISGLDINLSKLLDVKYKTISKELDKATIAKQKKSKRRSSSSDSSASSDSRRDHSRSKVHKRSSSDSSASSDSRRDHSRNKVHKRSSRSRSTENNQRNSRRNDKNRSPDNKRHAQHTRKHSNDKYSDRRQSENDERYKNRASNRDADERRKKRLRSRSPPAMSEQKKQNKFTAPATSTATTRTKLTDAERAARLREMVDNATWREKDRTESVQKHRDAYAREEAHNNAQEFDKQFINKEVRKAIDKQHSIGSRIRSNLSNIQRSSSAMNTNFARK